MDTPTRHIPPEFSCHHTRIQDTVEPSYQTKFLAMTKLKTGHRNHSQFDHLAVLFWVLTILQNKTCRINSLQLYNLTTSLFSSLLYTNQPKASNYLSVQRGMKGRHGERPSKLQFKACFRGATSLATKTSRCAMPHQKFSTNQSSSLLYNLGWVPFRLDS